METGLPTQQWNTAFRVATTIVYKRKTSPWERPTGKLIKTRGRTPWAPVRTGVLLGSVFGPFLFLMSINALDTSLVRKLSRFADDTMGAIALNSAAFESLQQELDRIGECLEPLHMSLNIYKCSIMYIGRANKSRNDSFLSSQFLTTTMKKTAESTSVAA